MQKNYIVDTNVLIDMPNCIEVLRNGEENNVYIPYHVLLELDKLKREPRLRKTILQIVDTLNKEKDRITILENGKETPLTEIADKFIIDEIKNSDIKDPILVTNDRLMGFMSNQVHNIPSQELKKSNPFGEDEFYTGIAEWVDNENIEMNSFYWKDGKLFYNKQGKEKIIDYNNTPWAVKPISPYQNAAMELMLDPDIDVCSVKSEAGRGKTYLALASALALVFQYKLHRKIVFVKSLVEIGEKIGYLPGSLDEKIDPYTRYIFGLLNKLHKKRNIPKIWIDQIKGIIDPSRFEIIPINYMRGMNIDNSVVILDEVQNFSRADMRTMLTRMGNNVKCIMIGDTKQVDSPHLNYYNNGLNWVIKKFKGASNYGHIEIKGKFSRGPITELALERGL